MLLVSIFEVKHLRFLMAFATSYALFLFTLVPFKYAGGEVGIFTFLINIEILLIFIFAIRKARQKMKSPNQFEFGFYSHFQVWFKELLIRRRENYYTLFVGLLLLAVTILYVLFIGPYTEIPADAWYHLGEFQRQYRDIHAGEIYPLYEFRLLLTKYAGYWYFAHAYISHLSGLTIQQSLSPLTIATTFTFLFGIYTFASFVFGNSALSKKKVVILSLLTVVFYALHFGVNIFSYIRYYAFAPGILNFVVYIAAIGLVIRCLRGDRRVIYFILLLSIFMAVLILVHPQEALFLVIMSLLVLGYYFVMTLYVRAKNNMTVIGAYTFSDQDIALNRIKALFILSVFSISVFYIYSYINVDRHDPLKYGRMIPIEIILPFLKNMYILNPGRDFYQVITAWGAFIYLVFFILFKELKSYPYIVVGMLVPFFTVFNPLFTDLFLRYLWPEVLWRISLLIPLPFVGAYMLVHAYDRITGQGDLAGKLVSASLVVVLMVLLFPVKSTFFDNQYSRIYTLTAVKKDNNYKMWDDLITYLETSKIKNILTDPVTGYVVKGITNKSYQGYKFTRVDFNRINYAHYDKNTFKRFADDWILIINLRDGGVSSNGERSGHWSKNILKVSQFYSEKLIQHIKSNPDIFIKTWDKD
ncbi:MAG: hypothetical protein ACC651_14770, partial [Candidatus Scalindua sp.]